MTFLLPETLVLMLFIYLMSIRKAGWLLLASGFFYAVWFYSTQLSHAGTYDLFATAAFFIIWISFILRIYEIRTTSKRRGKNSE